MKIRDKRTSTLVHLAIVGNTVASDDISTYISHDMSPLIKTKTRQFCVAVPGSKVTVLTDKAGAIQVIVDGASAFYYDMAMNTPVDILIPASASSVYIQLVFN